MPGGAKLNNAKAVNSRISYSNMTGANLYNANLNGTKAPKETLKDTVLCKAIMPSGQQNDSGCKR